MLGLYFRQGIKTKDKRKMKNISNLKRSLIAFRKNLVNQIGTIDNVLKHIENSTESKYCPKCLGKDLRFMKNNQMFCRSCGYDSRSKIK